MDSIITSISSLLDSKSDQDSNTKWRRPDWLVIGRIFVKLGQTPETMGLQAKRPILLFELKNDPRAEQIGDVRAGEEPNTSHVSALVASTIPQVLQQAQFVFSEFGDAGDTIHAIIAVGTFCQDFSISRSRLPPLSKDSPIFDPKDTSQKRIEDLETYAENMTDPYHILNKDRSGFHPKFLDAWGKARKVCNEFESY